MPPSSWAPTVERRLPHIAVVGVVLGLMLADPLGATALPAVAVLGAAARWVPRAAAVAVVAIVAGLAVGSERLTAIDAPAGSLRDGGRIAARAVLSAPPRSGPFGTSAELELTSGHAAGSRLLARLPRGPSADAVARPGAVLAVRGRLWRLRDSSTGFAAHLRSRGMVGELDVEAASVLASRRDGIRGGIDRVRERALEAVADDLPVAEGALARAMVLGADEQVPVGVRDDFRDSGLAHVLAASGQNVVLLCALAIPLIAAVGIPRAARLSVLLVLIALYVSLAGAGPPIQRAGVMGAVVLLAPALSRPASRWYALGLAACVTLVLNPRADGDPGWQLSFAAVAGILALAPRIARALAPVPRLLADAIAMTLAATLATAPLLAHHFGAVSPASLPANVAALPLVGPIMWLGMLRAALGQLPADGPLGATTATTSALLGEVIEPLLEGLMRLAALCADLPGARLALPLEGMLAVGVAYGALGVGVLLAGDLARRHESRLAAGAARLRRLPRRRRVMAIAGVVVVAGLVGARGLAPPGPPGALTVTFLDVGQGDATLIRHPDGGTVLFDGGPPEGGVVRLLRRRGVRHLSALVMTHASRDHHGGLAEVVERVPVGVLIDGGDGTGDAGFRATVRQAVTGGARRVAARPMTLRVGALRIDVLSPGPRPPGPPPEDPNPRAVVAVVSCGGFELLLSGDAESPTLLGLPLADVDALKLPHHGSADPGLAEVLERTRPELASIPVGENSYGHPAPTTLAALREAGVATWRNDRNGSVEITVDRGEIAVKSEHGGPVSGAP